MAKFFLFSQQYVWMGAVSKMVSATAQGNAREYLYTYIYLFFIRSRSAHQNQIIPSVSLERSIAVDIFHLLDR